MNHLDTSSCPCLECPGSSCACGCQDGAKRELQAGAACTCPAGCVCDGAKGGCLCTTAPAAA